MHPAVIAIGSGVLGYWLRGRQADVLALASGVGDEEDPGKGWSQAPTKQEQAQGYKKTDAMTLVAKVQQLDAKVLELAQQTAGESSEVNELSAKVAQLLPAVQALQAKGAGNYWGLLNQYNALQATYDDIMSRAEEVPPEEPAPAPAPGPKKASSAPAPAPKPAGIEKTSKAAVVVKKSYTKQIGLGLIGAAVAVAVAKHKLG